MWLLTTLVCSFASIVAILSLLHRVQRGRCSWVPVGAFFRSLRCRFARCVPSVSCLMDGRSCRGGQGGCHDRCGRCDFHRGFGDVVFPPGGVVVFVLVVIVVVVVVFVLVVVLVSVFALFAHFHTVFLSQHPWIVSFSPAPCLVLSAYWPLGGEVCCRGCHFWCVR